MSYDDMELIDENMFQQMLDMDDDNDTFEFTRMILTDTFSQLDESMNQFPKLMQKGDFVAVGHLAHKEKGSSSQIGCNRLKDIFDDMQHYKDKAGNPSKEKEYLQVRLDMLPRMIQEAKSELFGRIGGE